jgi:hypothetical protein
MHKRCKTGGRWRTAAQPPPFNPKKLKGDFMQTNYAKDMKARMKAMFKHDNWLERLGSLELDFIARTNADLCMEKKEVRPGIFKSVLRPEAKHKYKLYGLLRSKRRCPKNRHGETMLKQLQKENN